MRRRSSAPWTTLTPTDPDAAPLTSATTVKVMDFGLAKIEGASLLTAPHARLGTPQYMSPEQALGREADARADLYSLGVLLYELVTAVRPFDGDDVQSILSQHLNLAPVPPSVFNDALPATLEALILRLLEKDPAQRPASAAEVLHILDEIAAAVQTPLAPSIGGTGRGERGPSLPQPSNARSQSGVGGALYRRVFAGRAAEQRQLRAAYDAAAAGQGALALVVGEPGIGKTALCEQLAAYVTQRGGRVLWGHSYEEGSLSLPYLPFVEALRSYVADRPVEALRAELGAAAPDVARLISAIGERLQVEPRPAGDPDEARWRLLEAVAGFLRAAASSQPLLLMLEDLHWADRGALDLLTHLARNLTGARLLVVGTYRGIEVDRAHPLSKTLADLRRAVNFARIQLAGLPPAEVGQVRCSGRPKATRCLCKRSCATWPSPG
ncbi:MAG: serine/threonine-protein kinase [Chloroflexi bacterium]|nr:serine/threonine-protein kinase [Chloroflexota bacterium]